MIDYNCNLSSMYRLTTYLNSNMLKVAGTEDDRDQNEFFFIASILYDINVVNFWELS